MVVKCSGISSAAGLSDSMQEYIAGNTASLRLYQLAYDQKTYTDQNTILFKVYTSDGIDYTPLSVVA